MRKTISAVQEIISCAFVCFALVYPNFVSILPRSVFSNGTPFVAVYYLAYILQFSYIFYFEKKYQTSIHHSVSVHMDRIQFIFFK